MPATEHRTASRTTPASLASLVYAEYAHARPSYDLAGWGPAVHDPANPFSHEAIAASLAQRDAHGERPDDN